jgi:hypothetical protein
MSKRARRRAAKERTKAAARRLYPWCKRPERYADNLTVCSCWGCGNPRRWLGERTRQELREEAKGDE